MTLSYSRFLLVTLGAVLGLWFTAQNTFAANLPLGNNLSLVKADFKFAKVANNIYGKVATGDLIAVEAAAGSFEMRVNSVRYEGNSSTLIFDSAFSQNYAAGELKFTRVEDQSDFPNNLGKALGPYGNSPFEQNQVWVPGNREFQVNLGDNIHITNNAGVTIPRKVLAAKYHANVGKTQITLASSKSTYTVELLPQNTGLNGSVFSDARRTKSMVLAGAKSFWVAGQPFQNLNLGDQFVVSTDGSTSSPNAEVRTVQAFRVLGNVTQINFNTPLNNTHNGSLLQKIESVTSGTLVAELGPTVFSDILIANQVDVEILKVRLSANDDEIHVSDLYFQNNLDNNLSTQTLEEIDGGDQVDFKLYNEAGQLVQTEMMINGRLQFELGNTNRIRVPNNGSTTLSVRVDVRDIKDLSQTGKKLQLELDTHEEENGFEAVTAATGMDLTSVNITSNGIKGQEFLILNTQMALHHALTQPSFADPSLTEQEFYRFTVTADNADEVGLAQVKLDLALQGMNFAATPNYRVLPVKTDGTLDLTTTVATATSQAVANDSQDRVTISFINEIIPAGETKTYALLFDNTQQDDEGENDDDSISVTFITDNAPAGPEAANNLTSSNNLVWSDASDRSGGIGSDFFNGYLIDQDFTALVNQD